MLERVCDTVRRVLETEAELTEQTTMEDVAEWDSFGQVAIVAALEEEFGVSFSRDEIIEMDSIASILAILERR